MAALEVMLVIVYSAHMPHGIHSVKEAAEKLGISDSHCRRLLKAEIIKGHKLGHDWVVTNLKYKRKRKPKRRAER